jgi:predicted ATPase/class 3 adenylate cyclase
MQATMIDRAPLQQVAHRLAAYLPASLAQQILWEGLPPPGSARPRLAATLFSDISGFTRMAEELASDGPRGAEELNRVLLLTFTAMINVIHDAGGSVCHFHGDAMTVYFPEEESGTGPPPAALQALACAQLMQRLMATTFGRVVVNRPPHKDPVFYLTMKIGVAYGRCVEMVVGDPATSLEFVVAGPAVDEAAAAQQRAAAGEVVAAPSLLARAGWPSAARPAVKEVLPSLTRRPFTGWKELEQPALQRLVETGLLFVPPSLQERLQLIHHDFVAEHRPVTSLFVQFEGIDFEKANAGNLLQLYYEWTTQIVARFGPENGRLNRILTGDKGNQLHIFFGAPLAPDAPEQAVRCALALQRAKPAFITSQKIGVAAGKVFACPVGSQERREYTIVGDVVNLSARLTHMCPDGAVLVSEATAARVEQFIELEALEAVTIKGKQERVAVFRAVGEQAATAQLKGYFSRWQRPLVGREKELDLLLGGLDAALHGAGGVVAISGPVGVGKTRLLAAGVDYWLQAGGLGVLGLCQPHTADVPYAPWLHVWHDFFALQPQMNAPVQAEAVARRTRELVPDCGDDVGLWAEILGLPVAGSGEIFQLPAEVRRARFLQLAQRCILAAAAQRPLLFVLEDLHWADRASLDLIDQIAALASGRPIFLALTYRPAPELRLAALKRPFCTPLILADLPAEAAYRFVCAYIGETELPALLERHLGLRERDGHGALNPLFMEESLKVMLDTGVLEKNGRWRVNEQRLAEMQVPDTIHGLLLARLDRLPTGSRDLLQVASVIGRQFGLETLTRITEDTPRDLIVSLLSDLSEAELTRLITTDPELTYLFQHAMTRDVAYESLPYARRQALHAAIADWLVDRYGANLKPFYALLAYHYGQTDLHEKGLRYALAAAGEAKAIYANSDALELYCLARTHLEALGEEAHWPTAVDLCLASGEVLRELGNYAPATEHLTHALALAEKNGDATRTARSCNLLAEVRYRQSRFSEAVALAGRVITDLAPAIAADELARAYHWSGMASAALSDFATALDRLSVAEQMAVQTQNNERLARVLEALAFVHYSQQQLPEALAAMQRGLQLSRQFSLPINVGYALSNIALIQFNLGRAAEALATLNEAVDVARTTARNLLALTLMNRAEVLAYLGRFADALADFREAFDLFTEMDDEHGLLSLNLLWAWEYDLVRQEWRAADTHLQRARALAEAKPGTFVEEIARILIGQGRVLAADGRHAEADSLYQEAAAMIEEKDLCWWWPALYYYAGLSQGAQNKPVEARQAFQKAIAATRERGCPDYLCLALLEVARLEATVEEREQLLEQCIEAAHGRGRHLDRLACFREAGRMLQASRDSRRLRLAAEVLQCADRLEAEGHRAGC